MNLTLGGYAISAPTPKAMSHAAYGFWDAFITMGSRRNEAVALWLRKGDLHDRLEDDPDHPKADIIMERAAHLDSKIMQNQQDFLKAELEANRYWTSVGELARKSEEWDQMIRLPAAEPSIIGLWRVPFSEVFPAPPKGCRMSSVVLQFATPAQIAAYSMGGTR